MTILPIQVGSVLPIHIVHGGSKALVGAEYKLKIIYIGIDVVFNVECQSAADYGTCNQAYQRTIQPRYVEQVCRTIG